MPGKLSVNAFDIAWANASLLVLMFCPACKTDGPAEDTTAAPDDGTISLLLSNMIVARLLFVVRGIKSTQKTRPKLRSVEAEGQGIFPKKKRGRKNGPREQNKTGRITLSSATKPLRYATLKHATLLGALSLPCPQQTADRLTNTSFSL